MVPGFRTPGYPLSLSNNILPLQLNFGIIKRSSIETPSPSFVFVHLTFYFVQDYYILLSSTYLHDASITVIGHFYSIIQSLLVHLLLNLSKETTEERTIELCTKISSAFAPTISRTQV